jgi:4-hydroxybenzoate polyprenyltransferase
MQFGSRPGETTAVLTLLGPIACLSCVMASVYVLNQMKDIQTDLANNKLFLLSEGIIAVKQAGWEAGFFAVSGLVLGFLITIQLGITLIILFLLSGWLYNFPPFEWKNRPLMGLLVNGIGGWIIYTIGWKAAGGAEWVSLRSMAYALAGVSVFLNTTLPDMAGDEKTGKITFVLRYGVGKTAIWALILEAAAVVLALITRDWLLFIPGIISLPLFIRAAGRRTVKEVIRATKYAISALVIAVCIVFPLYTLVVLFIFFLTKWYYRKRFHFNYPNLRSV